VTGVERWLATEWRPSFYIYISYFVVMALGRASQQLDLLDPISRFCGETLPPNSIFVFLHEHRDRLFPDGMFSDQFAQVGRRSVPPSVVAVVMVLQRLEGLSDREAVDRFTFDARWRYAAGAGGWDTGRVAFAHTVLVDMRERLRRSQRPDRIFEVALAAAGKAGLLGRRRVLDSTPLYDAVATMDTVTLIRGLLKAAGPDLCELLRAVLTAGDHYASAAKPAVDWDDKAAREALIDSRARDGYALLTMLSGREGLSEPVTQAMQLLATVLGQDLQTDPDGLLRIAANSPATARRPVTQPSTATRLTAPVKSWRTCTLTTSTSKPRFSHRTRLPARSPRTGSPSTWTLPR
jgi:hypothetical protein